MRIFKSLEELKDFNDRTSIAIGLFDGLHLGHRSVIKCAIENAKELGVLSCVFTFQIDLGKKILNKETSDRISSEAMFYKHLEDMGVDIIVALPFGEIRNLDPDDFVKIVLDRALHAEFVCCGKDFKFGKNAKGTWTDLYTLGRKRDIGVRALPLVLYQEEPISSTRIRECIRNADIPEANDMLGHRYSIDFEVVAGNRIGRTLGTPTINQVYPKGYVVPMFGVYATLTRVEEKWYTSVSSVGIKPTIGDGYDPLSETYIQNFSGDLYGKNIQVDFLQFLRKEIKFSNIDELRERIQQDSREAAILGQLYL